MLELLSPPTSIDSLSFALLISISALSSFITASIGIGGGMIMLAVLAQALPISAVIQLGSNSGRAAMLSKHISWRLFAYFTTGGILGALLGGQLLIKLPISSLQTILAVFILYSSWAPQTWQLPNNKFVLASAGAVTTFLTMFVGATGPFVVTLLCGFKLEKVTLIASSGALLVFQHLFKVIVFISLGFVFEPYIGLMILMVCAGFIGTILGKSVLLKIDEQRFKRVLQILLSALAIRLLWQVFNT